MKLLDKGQRQENKRTQRKHYEAPAVIYESVITTRAGSPLSATDGEQDPSSGVDPADLFGNG